jgi:hypothetical protein
MNRLCRRLFAFSSLILLTGTLLGGCGDVGALIANFNPCGTILNCDPREYTFIRSGYRGPGVDPNVDPSCTYPPFCPADSDPFVPAIPGINA